MTGETLPLAPAAKKSQAGHMKRNLRDYGLLMSLLLIMVFFQFMTAGKLFDPLNITNIILQNSYVIIMALGMLLVIIAADIDLSVGSVVGFIGGLAAVLMVNYHVDFITASIICLVMGAAIGAAQGFWVAYFRIPAFIVTLAGFLVFRGLCLTLLQGQSVGPFPVSFQRLSSGFIPDFFGIEGFHLTSFALTAVVPVLLLIFGVRDRAKRFQFGVEAEPLAIFVGKHVATFAILLFLGYQLSSYKGLPNVLIIMAVLIAAYAFLTQNMTIGRRIYAMGGNEKAAQLSGIDTRRLRFYSFINMGVLAALAGLVFAARLNTATPKAGVGFELDVIAACFIGGASPAGGVGKVTGAVIGAFIMGVMNNGMSIVGIGIDWQQVIKGLVLLAAVIFDVYNKTKA
jgi:putative multiple sugar transport system permease protein